MGRCEQAGRKEKRVLQRWYTRYARRKAKAYLKEGKQPPVERRSWEQEF